MTPEDLEQVLQNIVDAHTASYANTPWPDGTTPGTDDITTAIAAEHIRYAVQDAHRATLDYILTRITGPGPTALPDTTEPGDDYDVPPTNEQCGTTVRVGTAHIRCRRLADHTPPHCGHRADTPGRLLWYDR